MNPRQNFKNEDKGSPGEGEPLFLAAGRLSRSHGVQGEIMMDILTDFPERLKPGKTVYIGDAHEPHVIASVRGHDRSLLLHFVGFDTPEPLVQFRNQILYVSSKGLPRLPKGTYYHHEILGLKVADEAGLVLGKLTNILETGANDVYVVTAEDGKEILFPAIDEVLVKFDLEAGVITIRPQEWAS